MDRATISFGQVMMRGKPLVVVVVVAVGSLILFWCLAMASRMEGWSEPRFTKQYFTPNSHNASKKASLAVYLVTQHVFSAQVQKIKNGKSPCVCVFCFFFLARRFLSFFLFTYILSVPSVLSGSSSGQRGQSTAQHSKPQFTPPSTSIVAVVAEQKERRTRL